jgi:penicillin-binding protein 1A
MVHQKPCSSELEHRSKRPRRFQWLLAIAGTSVLGLSIFYAANWHALTHLPQLAQARVVQADAPWTPLTKVSPRFQKALIATEDRSFYTNWGISFQGIARAALVDIQTVNFSQGGSTITQQLIRNLMLSPVKTIPRKVSGILLSLMADQLYSKNQILTLYVNEVYLGDHSYGVGQAAENYFGTRAQNLTLAEASLIAGMPQAPSAYDPLGHLRMA